MFTGIVSDVGVVRKAMRVDGSVELTIASSYRDIEQGESIAVDGACLTVESATPQTFSVHVVGTSLDRTGFAHYAEGRRVNLERALRLGDRLGGHLVQGHVDGLGTVQSMTSREASRLFDILAPAEIARVSAPLGSITVDGVSLTVNAKPAPDVIQISLIPFTLQHTTLGERRVGDRVHLEADTIGKYVASLLGNTVSGKQ
jgi:riboflavin synthase